MTHQLKEKVDYYEFLIDFLAHEISNPLTAIIMFARLLKEGAYGELEPGQGKVLDTILANSNRIEHMIEDFLNLNLVEKSGTHLRPETLDIARDIFDPVIDSLRKKNLFGPQKVLFRCVSRKSVTIRADRRLMNVVLDNLFFNAVKYGRPRRAIIYGWKTMGDRIVAWVSNEGQGVRQKDLGVIFDKFVRLKDPKIPPKQGTGLGLFNVRRIVEMHGGNIRAESVYGKNFTIRFTLPRPESREAVPAPRKRRRPK